MTISSVLDFIQLGAVGVIVVLFILGFIYPRSVVNDLKAEISELKQALEAERDRADAAVAAASTAKDVISAIQAGITLGRGAAQ